MEISYAGKNEPRMFTDGERAQPVVERAPRHTSRATAARGGERRSRNPLGSASLVSEPIPSSLLVTKPGGL
jgi:hypothetical protein